MAGRLDLGSNRWEASAAPSHPERWWRCSLQSTQWQTSGRRGSHFDVDTELHEELGSVRGQLVAGGGCREPLGARTEAAVVGGKHALAEQGRRQSDSELAGEVVVARTSPSQGPGPGAVAE